MATVSPTLPPPRLAHTLHHHQKSSVLSVAADRKHIFGGCQTADIHVWDRQTFIIKTTLQGHTGSVLALEIARDREWLFSSSSDSTVRIWDTRTLTLLYILTPHLDTSAGDIFSLTYSPILQTLYFGCQNTSLQWYDFSKTKPRRSSRRPGIKAVATSAVLEGAKIHPTLANASRRSGHKSIASLAAEIGGAASGHSDLDASHSDQHHGDQENEHDSSDSEPASPNSDINLQQKKWHPFFNNTTRFGRPGMSGPAASTSSVPQTPRSQSVNPNSSTLSLPGTGTSTPLHQHPRLLQVSPQNMIHSAHYGYIYCMAILPSPLEGAFERRSGSEKSFGSPSNRPMSLDNSSWEWENDILLMTGSGDETVKVWSLSPTTNSSNSERAVAPGTPTLLKTFDVDQGGVLSLIARDGTVYAGCQGGCVSVWDLETGSLIRVILCQENSDVLCLSMIDTDLYTCCANGWIQRWSAQFACTASWKAHEGIILSSIIASASSAATTSSGRTITSDYEEGENDREDTNSGEEDKHDKGWYLVTGANDNDIKIWSIDLPTTRYQYQPHDPHPHSYSHHPNPTYSSPSASELHDPLIQALSTFVTFPSVSNSAAHREDCRQAAIWLRRYLGGLGASARMIPTKQGFNPLVLATFKGVTPLPPGVTRRPRILFYGHYDVISAPKRLWSTDPFVLTGTNGYLYGRGISDNKGPIVAVANAVADLLRRRLLGVDVVFMVEGEEEAGSAGFEEAVRVWREEEKIRAEKEGGGREDKVDCVLISNSYWIGEDTPCITYGLRGVVHATIEISSGGVDLHSGVEGGGMREPMGDIVRILSALSEGSKVLIPGFYDKVRPQTDSEKALYTLLSNVTHKPAETLSSKWREPTLSLHSVESSGPGNATVIPASVKAKVSLRIVPDQDLEEVGKALVNHVEESFAKLGSTNKLSVRIDRTADWWLGDLESKYFKALEGAVEKEWGTTPLRIREGGSIPSIPFLEKEFSCPGLHLPMGQSSDQAHLANERISLTHLRKGKTVVERFLLAVSAFSDTTN
ncbi:hypothetical protein M422DRAFT_64082 [Sphaerobolus stellatus SS14]|nr:hypothetical protein M422DRAFT_64082 [Sphaerobolus stellatus SS14]